MSIPNFPALDSLITIERELISSFRQQGHVLVKGILNTEEIKFYRKAINKAVWKNNTETRAMQNRDTYSKAFLQIMNLWETDEQVRQFTLARRFAKIAADLLGVDHVRIYHDQALFKEPGGGFTPWHQDQFYWPLDTRQTVTMWMPLMDIDTRLGMLTFASGSHLNGMAENIPISDESETALKKYIGDKAYPIHYAPTMQAGDATWHYGWTLHNAPGNSSTDITREIMTVIYYADGARVTEPKNNHQQNDLKRWLGGIKPDKLADSSLNPLVY